MPEEVRLWRIQGGDTLSEITRAPLDLEARLEMWLECDISILSPGLLAIGRQVETDFGGFIDLLCLDHTGDVVVVELKRDKTPREITAQILDYGSWVKSQPC
jgi:RecB family endonuclease NucS